MNLLSVILQCGAFVIIPVATLIFGILKIRQFDEKYHRLGGAGLIGLIFFESSFIGMMIDPRSINVSLSESILTAAIIGIIAFLFVFLFLPVSMWIFRIFRK